jgi:hypothetical protein
MMWLQTQGFRLDMLMKPLHVIPQPSQVPVLRSLGTEGRSIRETCDAHVGGWGSEPSLGAMRVLAPVSTLQCLQG